MADDKLLLVAELADEISGKIARRRQGHQE